MTIFGLALGAAGAYSAGRGATARAEARADASVSRLAKTGLDLRDAHVRQLLGDGEDGATERLPAPSGRPKIILIFDDVGLDRTALAAIERLPGPLTLSFLPYAPHVADLADAARRRGDAVMLHLPMEPEGQEDAGPHSLSDRSSAAELIANLEWNLDQFSGYVAVNNHMGSRFTRDEAAMMTVLGMLKQRGVFFVDSLTTPASRAKIAGRTMGEPVYLRDVFLDPSQGEAVVKTQFAQVERIARETGYAVAICHPRLATLSAVGPWLTSAPARGFDLATVEALPALAARLNGGATLAMRDQATARPQAIRE